MWRASAHALATQMSHTPRSAPAPPVKKCPIPIWKGFSGFYSHRPLKSSSLLEAHFLEVLRQLEGMRDSGSNCHIVPISRIYPVRPGSLGSSFCLNLTSRVAPHHPKTNGTEKRGTEKLVIAKGVLLLKGSQESLPLATKSSPNQVLDGLSGSAGASFQSRYTIAASPSPYVFHASQGIALYPRRAP